MKRLEAFEILEKRVTELMASKDKPVRVAVNGIEGSGKTSFVLELVHYLVQQGIQAVHVGIDGFHNQKSYRYRQGRDSAQGYFEDSYNEAAFVEKVLLASQEDVPRYTAAVHDLETDELFELKTVALPQRSVIVTDGAYLFKPSYLPHWDLKVYLKVPFEVARVRGTQRDAELLGGVEAAHTKYITRYHAASQIYIEACDPEKVADIIFDNSDFRNPELIKC